MTDKELIITKSKTDKKLYRYIELKNRLRCLLISDEDSEQSAASMDVSIGSFHDPSEYPGLAHFLEHMLFLGTKKFPKEGEYAEFIKSHGGEKNAFTSVKETNFFFSIANEAFPEALDRFSEFFKEPLFNESATEREINAVDSEHKKNIPSDFRKLYQILNTLANPLSKVNRFSTGNKETLSHKGIRDQLIEFHKKNYSSNLMNLVLVGRHPLDVLEKLAEQYFSSIENKNLPEPNYKEHAAFDKSRLGKIIKYVPTSPKPYMMFKWALPDTHLRYKTKPTHYLAHLLGHEGPNSLLSYLIDEKLALGLTSYLDQTHADTDFLSATVDLTEKGLAEYQRVIEIVASFACMLKAKGPQEYIADELMQMSKLNFEYQNPAPAVDSAVSIALRMKDYPKSIFGDILSGPSVIYEYDAEELKSLINLMTPDNMLIFLCTQSCKADATLTEKWYDSNYKDIELTAEVKTKLATIKVPPSVHGKKIDLPPVNNLVPKSVALYPKPATPSSIPKLIKETPSGSVWYKQDHKFEVPKALGFCRIWTNDNGFPLAKESILFSKLFRSIFFEGIREFIYMAELAGIECSIDAFFNKITLSFSGYNGSLPNLVKDFLTKLAEFQPEKFEELFAIKKQHILKNMETSLLDTPFMVSLNNFPTAMYHFGDDTYAELKTLANFTFDKFVFYSKTWLKTAYCEWYITGNMLEETAIEILENAEKSLKFTAMPKELIMRTRTIKIPANTEYVLTKKIYNEGEKEENSCLISYFQGEEFLDQDLYKWCLNEVAVEIIKEKAFDYLRTKLQLGYVVDLSTSSFNRVLGARFLVQSAKIPPEEVYKKINEFLILMKGDVEKLPDTEFKMYIEAVSVSLRQKFLSLTEEAYEFWKEIACSEYLFDRKEKLLVELQKLKKEDVVDYFMNLFFKNPKRVDYITICKKHMKENDEKLEENIAEAAKKGKKRVKVASEHELRTINFIYPDMFLVNMRNNKLG